MLKTTISSNTNQLDRDQNKQPVLQNVDQLCNSMVTILKFHSETTAIGGEGLLKFADSKIGKTLQSTSV